MKKNTLLHYLHIYKMILVQDLKTKMSYRADFFISIFGILIVNVTGFLAFWIVFSNFETLLGWSYHEIMFLYGFYLLALVPVQCFFDNNWSLRGHVYSGDFVRYCFRPLNLFFYYMSEVFDIKGLGQFVFGAGMLAYAWIKLELGFSFLGAIGLVAMLASASLFMIALMNMAAATCFWIINSGYVMVAMQKIKDYAKYPVTIFSHFFKFIFTFVIPLGFIAYFPSLIFLRPDNVPILTYFTPLIGLLWFWISYKFWMKGAMSYSGTGS